MNQQNWIKYHVFRTSKQYFVVSTIKSSCCIELVSSSNLVYNPQGDSKLLYLIEHKKWQNIDMII